MEPVTPLGNLFQQLLLLTLPMSNLNLPCYSLSPVLLTLSSVDMQQPFTYRRPIPPLCLLPGEAKMDFAAS